MLRVVEKPSEENQELRNTLDEVLQRGALKMLRQALEAEVEEYITRHRDARDERGRAQVVRNGKAPARQLVTGSGTLEVRAPRVNDQRVDADGERQRFSSEILPSYMRRAPKVTEVLPILYLRGLSTGDFKAALPVLRPSIQGVQDSSMVATNPPTPDMKCGQKNAAFKSIEDLQEARASMSLSVAHVAIGRSVR